MIKVTTASELAEALKTTDDIEVAADLDIVLQGNDERTIVCSGSSQPRVVCSGSSQPRVECYNSSQPRVECSGSSQPRVECSGSSQPRVVCYGSSQPRVVCSDSSQPRVVCSGRSSAVVSGAVKQATCSATDEASLRFVEDPGTPLDWCMWAGARVELGHATLFKAVRADLKSRHGTEYAIGSTVVAPDWDGGVEECGGGLHFSARPHLARTYDHDATRFLEVRIELADMAAPKGDLSKIKARACFVVREVDEDGEPLVPAA